MNLSRRQFMYLAAAGAALPAVARSAWAQSWPNHVIRLVVGFPPGGGADAAARIAANRLSELWGQQVVVENRGGAGGNIAHDTVAHAAPDGYSILFSPGSLPIMPQLFPGLSFDPMTDFMPISTLGRYPNLVVVSKTSSMMSLKDYINKARADPGKVTFASPGIGTTPHLAAELLKNMAGIDITHVPYRGIAAGAMSDLLTAQARCSKRCARVRCADLRLPRQNALRSPRKFRPSPNRAFPALMSRRGTGCLFQPRRRATS